jgi:hypothetical protein
LKNGKKLKLGDVHVTPRNIQEVQASKLGDAPRGTPSSSAKIRSPFNTIYFLLLHALCVFLVASVVLVSVLFSFGYCNKWLDPNKFLLDKLPCFSFAKNNPFSILIVQRVFSFSATTFSFRFLPLFLFRSCYIFASRCILTSGPCWFSSKELLQKGSNDVGKEKKFHAKKWYKKELV